MDAVPRRRRLSQEHRSCRPATAIRRPTPLVAVQAAAAPRRRRSSPAPLRRAAAAAAAAPAPTPSNPAGIQLLTPAIRGSQSKLQRLHARRRAQQAHVGLLVREHAHRHHAGPLVHLASRSASGSAICRPRHVEDVLAVVGDQRLRRPSGAPAPCRPAPRTGARCAAPPSGSPPPAAESAPSTSHQLGFVGDADEAARLRRHDLLARERGAAALDHVAAAVDLVGAVDVDRQLVDLVGSRTPRCPARAAARWTPPNWTPRRGCGPSSSPARR